MLAPASDVELGAPPALDSTTREEKFFTGVKCMHLKKALLSRAAARYYRPLQEACPYRQGKGPGSGKAHTVSLPRMAQSWRESLLSHPPLAASSIRSSGHLFLLPAGHCMPRSRISHLAGWLGDALLRSYNSTSSSLSSSNVIDMHDLSGLVGRPFAVVDIFLISVEFGLAFQLHNFKTALLRSSVHMGFP